MSKRNSQAAKSAARERIRAQQEAERKREKRKRAAIVGVSIVGVIAIAGGVGYAVMQANKPSKPGKWEKAADAKVVAPANTSGKNGTTLTLGKSSTKNTVHLYEDPRCPGCAAMEQSIGSAVDKGMKDGDYKLSFTIGTFLDNNLGGEGSKNALSALGAALNVSPDAFLEFKTALYSAKFHPSESTDTFADDDELLKVADTVDSLKDNKKFESAVKKGTFDAWAIKMSDSFQSAEGVESTPTIKVNGKVIETPKTPDAWKAALKTAGVTK